MNSDKNKKITWTVPGAPEIKVSLVGTRTEQDRVLTAIPESTMLAVLEHAGMMGTIDESLSFLRNKMQEEMSPEAVETNLEGARNDITKKRSQIVQRLDPVLNSIVSRAARGDIAFVKSSKRPQ